MANLNENEKKKSEWLFRSEHKDYSIEGLGFKDREKAEETIRLLEDRDINYQYQVINSMYSRAKVIVRRTTNREKIKNITDAINLFESWIDDYKSYSRSKENFNYLPLETVKCYKNLAKYYRIVDCGFLKAYEEVEGDFKKLRGKKIYDSNITWDVHRNRSLKQLLHYMNGKDIPIYEIQEPLRGLPTKEHTKLIMWGYSIDSAKVKKCMDLVKQLNF